MLVPNQKGNYSFLRGIAPYSGGAVADSGSNPEIGFLGKDFTAELTRLQQAQQTAVDLRQQLGGLGGLPAAR